MTSKVKMFGVSQWKLACHTVLESSESLSFMIFDQEHEGAQPQHLVQQSVECLQVASEA